MESRKYDIFISYRRTAYDTANLIAEKLRHAGYNVFFDVDTLTAGKFNEQLLEVIGNCKDFIVVLPENALDRCQQADDWIRREVVCALEHHKNIIPVMLDGFTWPDTMPEGMEELRNFQAITSVNREYFDMIMQRLKGYLKSKPSIPVRKWLVKAAISLAVLLAFVGVGYGVASHIASVTCKRLVTQQASIVGTVDMIGDVNKEIGNSCQSFFERMAKCKDEADKRELEEELHASINKNEKNLQRYKEMFPAPDFSLQGVEQYVLAYYEINQEELQAFSLFYSSFYDDFDDLISLINEMIETHDYSASNRNRVTMSVNCIQYSINAFYYGYLGMVSLFPKSSREYHYKLSGGWKSFPNGTPLDLSQEEYEQFQAHEINCYKEEVAKFGAKFNYEEEKLEALEEQIDQLKEQAM